MPLHRDIHWIGRQWAVTGLGMQLIDQKLKGFFDIEASRLWEEALIETMRAKEWLNVADFEKGLDVARKRFPLDDVAQSPPAKEAAPAPPVAEMAPLAVPPVAPIEPSPVVAPPIAQVQPRPLVAKLEESEPQNPDSIQPPPAPPVALQVPATHEPEAASLTPPKFQMLFSGYAKFIRPWRARMNK